MYFNSYKHYQVKTWELGLIKNMESFAEYFSIYNNRFMFIAVQIIYDRDKISLDLALLLSRVNNNNLR